MVSQQIEQEGKSILGEYCYNGREAVNIIQLAAGVALDEERSMITREDIEWVIDNGKYIKRTQSVIGKEAKVGVVNGLAVSSADEGILMQKHCLKFLPRDSTMPQI